jgi:dihydroflavonol-4-reductase
MIDVARVLHQKFGAAAAAPRREIPNWVVRLLAPFVPMLRQIVPQLGILRRASNEKARRVLGWLPRTNEEAIAATGESLLRLGVVKPRAGG